MRFRFIGGILETWLAPGGRYVGFGVRWIGGGMQCMLYEMLARWSI